MAEKISKQFRLSVDVVERLEKYSRLCEMDMTEIVEEAVRLYSAEVCDKVLDRRITAASDARRKISKEINSSSAFEVAKASRQKALDAANRLLESSQKRKVAEPSVNKSSPKRDAGKVS